MKKTPSHAKETGTMRSKHRKERQEQSISVRNLPKRNEAKAKRQKVTPDYPRTRQAKDYKQLDLLQQRDELFDTYLDTVDRVKAWQSGAVDAYFNVNANHGHHRKMVALLTSARNEISKQLIQLDDAINSTTAL
jgi:hypothetical protein